MGLCAVISYTASNVRITTPLPISPETGSSNGCRTISTNSQRSQLQNEILSHLNSVQVPDPNLPCPAGCTCVPRGQIMSSPIRPRRFEGTITITRTSGGQTRTCTYRVEGTLNLKEHVRLGVCDCPGITFPLPRSVSSGGSSEYKKTRTKKRKTSQKKKTRKTSKAKRRR